jgi:hypothetical protein
VFEKTRDFEIKICFKGGMKTIPKLPAIPDDERTPLVNALLEIIFIQQEQIQELRDEFARLKAQKSRPKIKPSTLEKQPRGKR